MEPFASALKKAPFAGLAITLKSGNVARDKSVGVDPEGAEASVIVTVPTKIAATASAPAAREDLRAIRCSFRPSGQASCVAVGRGSFRYAQRPLALLHRHRGRGGTNRVSP